MPHLETPGELAEVIADMAGVYGVLDSNHHTEDCACRPCFVSRIEERIMQSVHYHYQLESMRMAVEREQQLKQMGLLPAFPSKILLVKEE